MAYYIYRNSSLVITESDQQRYGCDISFIGNMYVDDYFENVYIRAADATKNDIDAIINQAFGVWDGKDRIYSRLSEASIAELEELCGFKPKENDLFALSSDKYLATRLLARRLAYLERMEISRLLCGFDYRLYTTSKDYELEGVDIWPPLDYSEELPKAYHLSKINLNVTLHSITSGIPLRIFDIMGVGGFVLSNYQPEIEDCFAIGGEIEVYKDLDELEEKIYYYLSHENIRQKIALKGYEKVSEKYSYDTRFDEMLKHIGVCL